MARAALSRRLAFCYLRCGMTPPELLDRALRFRPRLGQLKRARPDIAWYPYDSLSNCAHLTKLLAGLPRNLFDLLPDRTVLDCGAGDGDLAFFFESLGYEVEAIDMEYGNFSALRGFRALHQDLGSRVRLHELDLDAQFDLAARRYSLALALGLLYHLKNPFYFLETLSRHARFCLLSSKIADVFAAAPAAAWRELPLAYFLSEDELNADDSNYWVFTEACLERLIQRAGWVILNAVRVDATGVARPGSVTDDSRVFALLASRRLPAAVLPGEGWLEPEDTGWRWTGQRFTLRLPLRPQRPHRLALEVFVPPALLEGGPNSITCRAAGQTERRRLAAPGRDELLFELPAAWRGESALEMEFHLERPPHMPAGDARVLGIIVAEARLRPAT